METCRLFPGTLHDGQHLGLLLLNAAIVGRNLSQNSQVWSSGTPSGEYKHQVGTPSIVRETDLLSEGGGESEIPNQLTLGRVCLGGIGGSPAGCGL
jgi:hypothetical protein